MCARPLASRVPQPERGSVLLAAIFIAMVVAGLAFGLVSEGLAARAHMVRSDTSARALELAEAGLLRAETRLAGVAPTGTLTLSGQFGAGTYTVAVRDLAAEVAYRQAHQPQPLPIPSDMLAADAAAKFQNRYWTWATGTVGQSTRTLEVHVRRWSTGLYREGLFSIYDLKFGGNSTTDAYYSTNPNTGATQTHASQLGANAAGDMSYALLGGDLGSNLGMITLLGSSTTVRGNAIPGDKKYVDLKGSVTITGDQTARTETRNIKDPPRSEFDAACAVAAGTQAPPGGTAMAQSARWTTSKAVTYNATTMNLSVGTNTTLTLRGGTTPQTAVPYFFTSLTIGSNSTLKVASGEYVKIYVTQSMTMSGNSTLDNAGSPAQLEILAHPYSGVPTSFYPDTSSLLVKLVGGSTSSFCMYAPQFDCEFHGGTNIYGAAIAKKITATGGVNFHQDRSLETLRQDLVARVERMYWAERSPPRR
jgi:hypothetical protein